MNMPTADQEFQEMKAATIREFEVKLKSLKARTEEQEKENQDRARRFYGVLKQAMAEAGVDVDVFGKLRGFHEEEAKRLEEYLARVRKEIGKGDLEVRNRAQRELAVRLARLQSLEHPHLAFCTDAYVVGDAEALADLKKTGDYLEPYAEIKHNPTATPVSPYWLKLKAKHSGWGSGLEATGIPKPVWGIFHFYYIPPKDTGIVDITAEVFYTGYWIVKANDTCLTSKSAEAVLDVWLRWQQAAYTSSWTKEEFMFAAGGNINFQQIHHGDIDTYGRKIGPLLGGHVVWITMAVELWTQGIGSGSHAEINYADGLGSCVWPMAVYVG